MIKERNGFTKSGFSKSFSCCGHHHICKMGRLDCIYKDKDPETMNGCAAFRRNNNKDNNKKTVSKADSFDKSETDIWKSELKQLSLF